jgi:hypothetical protein
VATNPRKSIKIHEDQHQLGYHHLPSTNHHVITMSSPGVFQLRKEKQNTGGDGLIFVGHRVTPTVTVGRPAESELDAWFERKSDQVRLEKAWNTWEESGGSSRNRR